MTDKEKVKFYEESPFVSSYEATYATIERFNKQLKDNEINILSIDDKVKFEMAHKYLTELSGYLKTLSEIRGLMSPEQQKEIEKPKNHKKSETEAF